MLVRVSLNCAPSHYFIMLLLLCKDESKYAEIVLQLIVTNFSGKLTNGTENDNKNKSYSVHEKKFIDSEKTAKFLCFIGPFPAGP